MAKDIDQQILDDLRQFDFVAQNVWPYVRGLFKRTIAARCSQCVISSRVPYVTLTDGVCNLCHEHNKLRANDEETVWQKKYIEHQRKELDQLLKGHQGKGRDRYDALVLFSGGKDSVYMLSRLRKEYPGLRVLLMTWDNGFYSKLSLQRCKEVAAKLDLDHIVYRAAFVGLQDAVPLYPEECRNEGKLSDRRPVGWHAESDARAFTSPTT